MELEGQLIGREVVIKLIGETKHLECKIKGINKYYFEIELMNRQNVLIYKHAITCIYYHTNPKNKLTKKRKKERGENVHCNIDFFRINQMKIRSKKILLKVKIKQIILLE